MSETRRERVETRSDGIVGVSRYVVATDTQKPTKVAAPPSLPLACVALFVDARRRGVRAVGRCFACCDGGTGACVRPRSERPHDMNSAPPATHVLASGGFDVVRVPEGEEPPAGLWVLVCGSDAALAAAGLSGSSGSKTEARRPSRWLDCGVQTPPVGKRRARTFSARAQTLCVGCGVRCLRRGFEYEQDPQLADVALDLQVSTGASDASDVWESPEGIEVSSHSTAADIAGLSHLHSVPGEAPFIRGPYPTMTERDRGQFASTLGFPPPRSPTRSIGETSPRARRGCRSPLIWRRTVDTTRTILASRGMSAWQASRSTAYWTCRSCSMGSRSTG